MKDSIITSIPQEELPPIFSLNISFTGCQFTVDANQLNTLIASSMECDLSVEQKLDEIQKQLRSTFRATTALFEETLTSLFGEDAVVKNETSCVSESTIFFIGGEDNDD